MFAMGEIQLAEAVAAWIVGINAWAERNLSHLRRLQNVWMANPVLTHWANFCRASGALSWQEAWTVGEREKVRFPQ